MAAGYIATEDKIQQLTDLLSQISAAGLPRPDNCLLSDYLLFLVEHQILSPESAPRVESICYASRYGGTISDPQLLAETAGQVAEGLSRIKALETAELQELADELSAAFAMRKDSTIDQKFVSQEASEIITPMSSLSPPTEDRLRYDRVFDELSGPLNINPAHSLKPNLYVRFWTRLAVAVLLWTSLVLAAGYFAHDQIHSAVAYITEEPYPAVINVSPARKRNTRLNQINNKRAVVLANEHEALRTSQMKNIGFDHLRRREYADLFFVYEHLLARDPENANLKNSLAWFLLIPHNRWYRDPVRAQRLAEEAVAADPQPAFLDTLAEAAHQNGDSERAVALEERAIAAQPQDIIFYENQLQKFREAATKKRALTAKESTPAEN